MENYDNYDSDPEFPPVDFNYIATVNQLPLTTESHGKSKKSKSTKTAEDVSTKKWLNKREKVEKIIAKKCHRNIQPGECMKFLRVDFDEALGDFDFCQESQLLLDNATVKTRNVELIVPSSLSWMRFVEDNTIDSNNEIVTAIREESQQEVMVIWNWDKIVWQIHDQSFQRCLTDITAIVPGKKISLIIYKMEGYFSHHRDDSGKSRKLEKGYHNIGELPKISRKDFECSLVEAQISLNCNITLIENSQDMSSLIFQHTKAIAEIPYKMRMRESDGDKIDFYAMGDNKNTIRVDGDGYGLRRLWLRQLCLFNNAGLATAEAICAVYASPLQLMKAYEKCSAEEGEALLKDIPIRRGPGELCTQRRIGSELSRKIYVMFTSTNGLQLLN